jgi:hypothetical protein
VKATPLSKGTQASLARELTSMAALTRPRIEKSLLLSQVYYYQESCSFLKKRTKRLLFSGAG